MRQRIAKAVAEGPNVKVTISFMDDGSVRFSLPNGPWVVDSAFSQGPGTSQIIVSRKGPTNEEGTALVKAALDKGTSRKALADQLGWSRYHLDQVRRGLGSKEDIALLRTVL